MTSEEFRNNPMFLRNQFVGDGVFEIPKLRKDEIDLEKIALIGYDKLSENETEKIVHFFLDDYKFEVMWNRGEPGSKEGGWYNPKTKETMHPDLEHSEPYGSHWDYKHPDGWKRGYRIYPDGTFERKIFEGDDYFA